MLALYKEHVLGDKPAQVEGTFVPLGSIGGIKPAPAKEVADLPSATRQRILTIWVPRSSEA